MSQQGEKPANADDWWSRLYDESAPDTGPAGRAGDTLDDRFHSAVDTTTADVPSMGGTSAEVPSAEVPTTDVLPPPAAGKGTVAGSGTVPPAPPVAPRPRAWWETPSSAPGAPWEPLVTPPAPADSPPGPTVSPPVSAPPASAPPASPSPASAPSAPQPGADRGVDPDAGVPAPRRHTAAPPRLRGGHVGDGPPTYAAEPTALPAAEPQELGELVPDTALDGARYGVYTLRAASVRGDSARYRGETRRDALLVARFGAAEGALVLVAVATGARATEGAHRAAADAIRWIGGAVGRSHARLGEDIRAGRRGDLKSGLHRLTDRSFGKLRARAAELGLPPEEYTASLRCLLLSADPDCRTRVFFGIGGGGLFRLRDGVWQDIEPVVPGPEATAGDPVVGYGSPPPETPDGDRLTMDLGLTTAPPRPPDPSPPPAEPFRFRASVARPGDTLLLCSTGLADPLRGEPALAQELGRRWEGEPPGLAAYLADTQLRVKGYADDRTACAVWEA